MKTRNRLRFSKRILLPVAAAALLPACATGGSTLPDGGTLRTYKYFGSVQCSGGGVSLGELQRELKDAGISVLSARCGIDGNMHAAMCGAPDGKIGILEIPAHQAEAASKLGFLPLKGLPDAREVPCP